MSFMLDKKIIGCITIASELRYLQGIAVFHTLDCYQLFSDITRL